MSSEKGRQPKLHTLIPFFHTGSLTIAASLEWQTPQTLEAGFVLEGLLDRICWPDRNNADFDATALWKSTCFEVFLRAPADTASRRLRHTRYWEFNFSPAGLSNAYRFDTYRGSAHPERNLRPGVLRRTEENAKSGTRLRFVGTIDIPREAVIERAALSAVIRHTFADDSDTSSEYYALAHPSDKPDFHHADAFCLPLTSSSG